MMSEMSPALELRSISRSYNEGEARLDIFRNLDLTVYPGEIVALVGPSGAGKSSLLHIAGQNCTDLPDVARTRVRRIGIGFVYQFHHLLPEFSALENVMLPQLVANVSRKDARARAEDLLSRLGLGHRISHQPGELSGGERQRVAIARAIANRPLLLLADEPTGNLDPTTADHVHEEFLRLIAEEGLGALIATHNHDLAHRMHRVVQLSQGRLIEAGEGQ